MSNITISPNPSYVTGGVIALIGLVLAWLLPGFLPTWTSNLIAGAITGGFGVAAAARIWPGVPMKKMIEYGPAMAVYGVVIGLIVGA